MIVHIVTWTFKDHAEGRSKEENMIFVKKSLESLKAEIPEIVSIEVGLDFSRTGASHDLALYSEFQSIEDLETYQKHPSHMAVADYIGKVRDGRVVVDYVR